MQLDPKRWDATPDELPKCPWYGTHQAGRFLFPSGNNTCPLSNTGRCALACNGLRPDAAACLSAEPDKPRDDARFVLTYATGEIVPLAEWEERVASRL